MITTLSNRPTTRGLKRHAARTVLFAVVALVALSTAQADDRGYRHHGGDRGGRYHERYDDRFYDVRHHHNRYYPAPGHFVTTLPAHRSQVIYGGVHFFFSDGIWFRGDDRRFVVVAPPLGIGIRVLPHFYTSLWIGGVPYYYANNVYYTEGPQGYVVTQPPAGQPIIETPATAADSDGDEIVEQPANTQLSQAPADLYVYPARGQSQKQLSADRNECHAWAVKQAGYDPNHASTGFQIGQKRLDYDRAITACLEGRGYTVK